jgi:hypothetical protein
MPSNRRQEPTQVIAEIQQLGSEIEQRLTRIFELSDTLYSSCRHGHLRQERTRMETDLRLLHARMDRAIRAQEPHDLLRQIQGALDNLERQLEANEETVPIYTMYSNAWRRFAGSLHQGLRRTAGVNRLVQQVERKYGVTAEAAPPPQPPARSQATPEAVNDLMELYGGDTVDYAHEQ